MISKFTQTLSLAAIALATLTGSQAAEARSAKPHYVQDYHFKKPMHGYSGRAGEFYCDYVRLPERRCTLTSSGERCRVVGWTLRQTCY